MKKIVFGMLLVAAISFTAQAVDRTRANINTNNIATASTAWTGGIPGASDVAVFGSGLGTAQSTNALGSDVSWAGIRVTNLTRAVTIKALGTETLTLGSSGIDMSYAKFGLTINPNVLLGAAQTWAVSDTLTLAVSGVISDTSGNVLTKSGLGTLTLNAANTFNGGIILSNGTINLGNNAALGTGALTISGGSLNVTAARTTLNNNAQNWNGDFNFVGANTLNLGTGAVTLGGNRQVTVDASTLTVGGIIGDGANTYSLTKAGAGALILTNANTYKGGTVLNAGTLTVTNGGTLGSTSGALTASGGTLNLGNTSQTVGSTTISGGTITNGTLTGSSYDGQSGTVAAVLAGGSSVLTKSTSGTLTLSGANTYGGGTVLSNGIIRAGNNAALGTGTLTLNGGTLSAVGATGRTLTNKYVVGGDATLGNATDSGTLTLSGTGDLGTAARTLTIDSDVILNGVITNTGGIAKSGAGTLTLSGNNTFNGGLTLNSGVLKTAGVTTGVLGAGTLALNGGELWFAGNANRAYGRNTTVGGNVTITSDRSAAGAGYLYTLGTLDIGSQTMAVKAGSLVNSGVAAVTFGTTTLGGTSVFDVTNNIAGVSSVLTLGALNGAGSLTKNGDGTLTLGTAAGTFSGGTTLNLGTLNINNASALGTGRLTINGGTIDNSTAAAISNANNNAMTFGGDFAFTGTKDLNLGIGSVDLGTGARTVTANGGVLTVGGAITNSGSLVKFGNGALTLSGANTYGGGTVLNSGALNINSSNALGTGTFTINGGTIDNTTGADIINSNNNSIVINNNFSHGGVGYLDLGTGAITLGTSNGTSRTITLGSGNPTLTINGNISDGTTANQLIKDGTAQLNLYGTNTFSGGLVIKKGTVSLNKYGSTAGGYTYAAGTGAITLGDAAGGDAVLAVGSYTLTNDINLASGAAGNLSIGVGGGATRSAIFTGAIALNGKDLTLDAAGSSANVRSYGAITGIGNLVLSNRTSNTGYVLLGSNTVNNTGTITSYSIATNTGGNVINSTIGGNVTGVTVSKGTLTLSGTNSYTGDTTLLNTTTLSVTKDENLGAGSNINMAQNANLSIAGSFTTAKNITLASGGVSQDITIGAGQTVTVDGTVSGGAGGGWRKAGGGTLELGHTNSYSAGLTVIGGKVKIVGSGTLGDGTAGFALNNANGDLGGTTQNVGTFTLLNGSTSSLSNGTLVATSFVNNETANGVGTVSAVLAGTGAFNHIGLGKTILAADNTYSGGTLISAGRIQVGNGGTAGKIGSGNVTNNASLVFNRSDVFTVDNVISGTGSLTNVGTGTLTLNAVNTYTGNTTIEAGKLVVNGILTNSLVQVNFGGALGGTGTVGAVTLDAGAILTAGNSPGTLTFEGELLLSAGSTNIMEIASDILFDVLKGNGVNKLTADGLFVFDFGAFGNTVTNGSTFAVLQNWGSYSAVGATFDVKNLGGGKTLDTSTLFTDGTVKVVPEPTSIGLLGVGALSTMLISRLRRPRK